MDNKKVYKKIDVIKLLDLQCKIMHCTIDLRYTEDDKNEFKYDNKADAEKLISLLGNKATVIKVKKSLFRELLKILE